MSEPLLTLPVETSAKGSGNEGINRDPGVPRHTWQAIYITEASENLRQSNEVESHTRAPDYRMFQTISFITAKPQEDLAEEHPIAVDPALKAELDAWDAASDEISEGLDTPEV